MVVGGLPSMLPMKLPSMLEKFMPKKTSEKEIFSSLVIDEEYVAAALWEIGDGGIPKILTAESAPCESSDWEARLDAIDEALARAEDAVHTTQYSKVVLGLPAAYLTESGEIPKEIRPHIKTITHELALTPIGFVPIEQALVYQLKKEEGIPPSVILLGISKHTISVSLYRVGVLTAHETAPRSGDLAITLEEVLKTFKHVEVLPARIFLYGYSAKILEELKTDLLRYQWTTRLNFLHFPKIEIVKPEGVISAVSIAGASEVSHTVDDVEEAVPVPETPPLAQPEEDDVLESEAEAEAEEIEEEPNIVAVDPSELGFRKNVDVLEDVEAPKKRALPFTMPAFSFAALKRIDISRIKILLSGGKRTVVLVAAAVLLLCAYLLYYLVPHASVTVVELPKEIVASEQITIDPTATVVDAQTKIIPGASQEKSVSGQKTIPVTGKKQIGDPAKGAVTIYNKTLQTKSFAKGAVLTAGSLQFTLDDEIQIASASESVGSITFGKTTANVTAKQIGKESNVPASTEFTFKDVDSGVAIARNDQAFTGGTSRDVTVVSRADYDAFLTAISADLVDKAKQELTSSVGGGSKLIDETIKTAVTQKTFAQELDQEVKELSGNATVTVSGISYSEADVQTLLKAFITKDIPTGYTLAEGRTKISMENVKVGKDGKISAKATIKTDAVPTLDLADIRKRLAGKKLTDAQAYLRSLPGIAGIEVRFSLTFNRSRLPINSNNINVSTSLQ